MFRYNKEYEEIKSYKHAVIVDKLKEIYGDKYKEKYSRYHEYLIESCLRSDEYRMYQYDNNTSFDELIKIYNRRVRQLKDSNYNLNLLYLEIKEKGKKIPDYPLYIYICKMNEYIDCDLIFDILIKKYPNEIREL